MSQMEIVAALQQNPEGLNIKQLIQITGLSEGTIYTQVKALQRKREIVTEWYEPPKGQSYQILKCLGDEEKE